MPLKLFAAFALMVFAACAFSQPLKIIKPNVTVWDMSPAAKEKFERYKELCEALEEGKKTKEDFTSSEKKLYDELYVNIEEGGRWEYYGTSSWIGCSWYCGAELDSIHTSSFLPSATSAYAAENLHDFDVSTAWVEGKKGYGIGEKLDFFFLAHNPPVTEVHLYNGYMKSEKAWTENSRVRTLKIYVNDRPYALLHVEDIMGKQVFITDTIEAGDKPLKLTFEIYDVYPGTKYDETAISEINFDGTGVHCFAAGTTVKMANGSEKAIENIIYGDKILTYNLSENKTESATVLSIDSRKHHNLVEIKTLKGTITATTDHPFYVRGKGWCAVNAGAARQYAGMEASKTLGSGDFIYYLENGKINYAEIISIQELDICVPAYTITRLSNGNSFFANGCLVAIEE